MRRAPRRHGVQRHAAYPRPAHTSARNRGDGGGPAGAAVRHEGGERARAERLRRPQLPRGVRRDGRESARGRPREDRLRSQGDQLFGFP